MLDIPVAFGGVSIGDQTARLGVTVGRTFLNLVQADEALNGKRISGKVILLPKDSAADSQPLRGLEDCDEMIEGAFDVKRIGASPDDIGFGLTMNIKSIEIRDLAKFAKRSGRLIVVDSAALPDDEDGGDEDDHEPDARQQELPVETAPKKRGRPKKREAEPAATGAGTIFEQAGQPQTGDVDEGRGER
jgi:hypothetical protein